MMMESYCLKVPIRLGEKAISLAARLGLLDKGLKIYRVDMFLFVPLTHKPCPKHVVELKKTLSRFEITTYKFPRRINRPSRIIDLLYGKLPPHLLASTPRSIDFIGDIAIVEFPLELEEHKRLIGEVILNVHKQVRLVLAKSSAVKGVYRLRDFEVIAGSGSTETVHREYGCIYHLDLSKVYFSPRLSYEHYRVASQVHEGEVIVDMFAGIGPFSVLIAKKREDVKIYAIDINPDAIRYLKKNIAVNKVQDRVVPIQGDAEKVIRKRLRGVADRVIMNLPERSIKYVEAAVDTIKPEGGIIHYYGFAKDKDPIEDAKVRLIKALKETNRKALKFLFSRLVRATAPFTWQVVVDLKIK